MDLIYYFPLEDCYTQEKWETLVMQNLGVKKVHYGLGELFLYCYQFIQNNLQSTMLFGKSLQKQKNPKTFLAAITESMKSCHQYQNCYQYFVDSLKTTTIQK